MLRRFKINLINCFLDRRQRICSSYQIISEEFEQIKTMMSRNAFPKYVLDKYICEILIVNLRLNHYFQRKKSPIQKRFSIVGRF